MNLPENSDYGCVIHLMQLQFVILFVEIGYEFIMQGRFGKGSGKKTAKKGAFKASNLQ